MWETIRREEGDLLPAGDGGHHVDGGDPRLEHLLGVHSLEGVDGLALNVQEFLGQHGRAFVDGHSRTIERTPQHLLGDRHLHGLACELAVRVKIIDA